MLRLDAESHFHGEIFRVEVDRFHDANADIATTDLGFVDDESFGIFKSHGDELAFFLDGAIHQPNSEKEAHDGDDPDLTNAPAVFDFRLG